MPTLTIFQGNLRTDAYFEGAPVLSSVLRESGFPIDLPCGGKGVCSKCRVVAEGVLSPLTAKEREAGCRLACQTVLLGDATVTLQGAQAMQNIAVSGERPAFSFERKHGRYGLAVDIGTTTLAASLLSLESGQTLAVASKENPQRNVAADVIGRIEAAMNGQSARLKEQITSAIEDMRREVCAAAGMLVEQVDTAVVTGNTTMLYLLTGKDPARLSRAPFDADCLFGISQTMLSPAINAYLPRCFSAFVGADIVCALLAAQMDVHQTSLLVDIGTNGEIALMHGGKLYACATAAGPAFEGGGIERGVGSVAGAIDRVWAQDGKIVCSTIADAQAAGICGSGIIDATATLRALDILDETGALDEARVTLKGEIAITQKDIRSVQLAKSAIAAGMMTLLDTIGVPIDAVDTLFLAGGFGKHIDLKNAAAIGLIPAALQGKVKVIGNASLAGAEMLLLRPDFVKEIDSLPSKCTIVTLSSNPVFSAHYMDCMMLEPI